jgi:hypothetical protein
MFGDNVHRNRSFEPLSEAEAQWVRKQLGRAREFVRDQDPGSVDGPPTLELLDRAFCNYLASASDPGDANAVVLAVGVAFGVRLVEDLGFEWVIATDDYGTDLAVLARRERGDVTIFPTEFVSKRCERREAPFLVASYAEIRHHLGEIATKWGDPA